ncbi:MAG: tautomerase family protein [Desulfotomaculaceae bacterium]|nr:tautomerase family protein [Desulfotomaculaceae bacterium]
MPVITVEASKMDRNKKALLVKELTQKASEILSIPPQAFVTLIKENDMDNIGTGGQLLSDKMAK